MNADLDEAKQRQRELWDALSPNWEQHDAWFGRQTHTITDWLCRVADLRGGQKVLDIACGTGQPALTAARLVRPGGSIVAIDISQEMLRVARRKANMADMDNIEFQQMDAEAMEFDDETFDGAICRWGLMFFPNPEKAVAEAYRVLKPHRPFAATTFAGREHNPFQAINDDVAAMAVGAPPGGSAADPLRLADTANLKSIMAEAGFQNIELESRPFTFEFNSLDDYWRICSEFSRSLSPALKQADGATQARMREALLDQGSKYRESGRVRLPALALGVYGQK